MQLPALLLSLLPLLASAADNTELLIKRTLTHKCARPTKTGDTVNMHYRGTLQADGKEFDASYKRGTPLSFQLGAGRVIKGWDLGLLDMCPGDKRTLTIPPELGYGARGMGPIPASATLVFETELVSINGVDKEPLVIVPDEADLHPDAAGEKMAEKINEAVKEEAKEEAEQKKEGEGAETTAAKAEPAEPTEGQNPQEDLEKEKEKEEGEKTKDEL
ncbi:Peptidyl-prolyl cis-trans isomerase fpr2 [Thelotrema lepadinum]|nr:Peptidyl-prolyl cis-trans isomerase fpr2 [Thelotrema lepadinum]